MRRIFGLQQGRGRPIKITNEAKVGWQKKKPCKMLELRSRSSKGRDVPRSRTSSYVKNAIWINIKNQSLTTHGAFTSEEGLTK